MQKTWVFFEGQQNWLICSQPLPSRISSSEVSTGSWHFFFFLLKFWKHLNDRKTVPHLPLNITALICPFPLYFFTYLFFSPPFPTKPLVCISFLVLLHQSYASVLRVVSIITQANIKLDKTTARRTTLLNLPARDRDSRTGWRREKNGQQEEKGKCTRWKIQEWHKMTVEK